jgi:hypothetical protein
MTPRSGGYAGIPDVALRAHPGYFEPASVTRILRSEAVRQIDRRETASWALSFAPAATGQNFMVVRIPNTRAFGIGDGLFELSGLGILPPG